MSDGSELSQSSEFTLNTAISFSAADVVASLSPERVLDLIEDLDEEVSTWEVSLLAYHHFKAQYELALTQVPELAVLSIEELEARLAAESIEEAA